MSPSNEYTFCRREGLPSRDRLGLTETIEASLKAAGVRVELFNGVVTEPTLPSIEAAEAMYRERSCDLIVGVGGGSSMDSAKAVGLLIGNGGKFTDYTEKRVGTEWQRGRPIDRKGPDVITVPTTAGTGADVTAGCGVFDLATGIKGWAGGPRSFRNVDEVLSLLKNAY